jgi:hypothetical protein
MRDCFLVMNPVSVFLQRKNFFFACGFEAFTARLKPCPANAKPKARDPSNLAHGTDETYHHPYV